MMRFWPRVFLLTILASSSVSFAGRGKNASTSIEAGVGFPSLSLTTAEGDSATYRGLGFSAKGSFQILSWGIFATAVTASYSIIDFENSANSASEIESSKHRGFGGGLRMSLARVFIESSYQAMSARHLTVRSSGGGEDKFSYNVITHQAGLAIPFLSGTELTVSYAVSSGDVPGASSSLGSDTHIEDKTFWLRLKLNMNMSLADALD